MKELEEANQILDKIVLPSGDEQFLLHRLKDASYVRKITDKQQVYINQELSKQLFGNTKRKFSSPALMDSYLLSKSDTYNKMMSEGFVFNRGIIVGDMLLCDPIVEIEDNKLFYSAKTLVKGGMLKPIGPNDIVGLDVNPGNAFETFVKAGLMDRRCSATAGSGVYPNADGVSPLRSYYAEGDWGVGKRFFVGAGGYEWWPGYSYLASKLVH
jgi:hypothetical protein